MKLLSNTNVKRLAIIDGIRTPMGKYGGALKDIQTDDLGALVFRDLLSRLPFDKKIIDEVIVGCVANPSHAANIARVIGLKAGFDLQTPAFTVSRNCGAGLEAVSNAMVRVNAGYGRVYAVMGAESMSNIPMLFNKKMKAFFEALSKARSLSERLKVLSSFRLGFLTPVIAVQLGLTDPTCDLIMGLTAENIAADFKISREEQDIFAARSHNLAEAATKNGIFNQEILKICTNKEKAIFAESDEGIRNGQTKEALAKLKPFFLKPHGSVTVGNSSQITDGACGMILMDEDLAKEQGLKPLGYVKNFAFAGCDQTRMGLGPVFAIYKLLKSYSMTTKDIDLFEINEAFSAQVIGCLKAFESKEFFKKHFDDDTIGSVDIDKLNVNGGAIALGHPVGMSGARVILHLAKELKRRNLQRGIASLCIGGGQGGSIIVEAE
jgi:acetyl-CoA C-acetyltransferase